MCRSMVELLMSDIRPALICLFGKRSDLPQRKTLVWGTGWGRSNSYINSGYTPRKDAYLITFSTPIRKSKTLPDAKSYHDRSLLTCQGFTMLAMTFVCLHSYYTSQYFTYAAAVVSYPTPQSAPPVHPQSRQVRPVLQWAGPISYGRSSRSQTLQTSESQTLDALDTEKRHQHYTSNTNSSIARETSAQNPSTTPSLNPFTSYPIWIVILPPNVQLRINIPP